jgi:hypothetical protein
MCLFFLHMIVTGRVFLFKFERFSYEGNKESISQSSLSVPSLITLWKVTVLVENRYEHPSIGGKLTFVCFSSLLMINRNIIAKTAVIITTMASSS